MTVLIPVFNGERYLGVAVRSILTQTYADFECIIVDDGSTDGTHAILRTFGDPRLKIFRNGQNEGIVAALNRGIANAQGTYLCRMDADDIAAPTRLERQVAFMDEHSDVAVLGSYVHLIDEMGSVIGEESYPVSPEAIRRALFRRNPLAHGAVMVRLEILRQAGGYDRRFLHNEDYDLWLRLAVHHQIANLPEPLLLRRIHAGSITGSRETELVRYRLLTIAHAIRQYYRSPWLVIHLVRPAVAFLYRRIGGSVRREA